MEIAVTAVDNYHPDMWHNDKIGEKFEVIKFHNDRIPPVIEVKYKHASGRARTAFINQSCVRIVNEY